MKRKEYVMKAIDDCLAALKFIPDWFVRIKMLRKFDNALHATDEILLYKEDFDKVTFIANFFFFNWN